MTPTLPAELIDAVFSSFDIDTLKSCRLVSWLFHSIASSYAFETVHIALFRENLEHFIHVASNPMLSPCVKNIVFHGQLPRKFRSRQDWEKYIDFHSDSPRPKTRRWAPSGLPSTFSLGATESPSEQALPRHDKSEAELQQHWLQYLAFQKTVRHFYAYLPAMREGVGPEDAVRESNPVRSICDDFFHAVTLLPNLKSATVKAHESRDNNHPLWRRIQQRVLLMPCQWKYYYPEVRVIIYDYRIDDILEGVVQSCMLLTALAALPRDRKLRALDISLWSPYAWDAPHIPWYRQNPHSMTPAFSTITNLCLQVGYDLKDRHTMIIPHQVSRFLHQANALVSLSLFFIEEAMEEPARWDLLLLLHDVSWPKMRRLELATIMSQAGILGVLTAVAPTLRELCLNSVMLYHGLGIWENVLKRIPQIVNLHSIQLGTLYDNIYAEGEETAEDEEHNGRHRFKWDYEHDHHCQALYNYLTRRSTTMPPLRRDVFLRTHRHDCAMCRDEDN